LHVTSTVGGAGIVVGPTAPYTTSGGQFSLAVLNDGLTSGQYNAIQIGKSGSNSLFFTYNYTGAAATDYTSFTQYGSSAGTSLVVQGSGRVGVGTTNPVYTFDVLGIVRAGSTVSSSIYLTNSEVKWRGDGTAHFSIFNQNSTFQIRNTGGNFEPGTAGSNLVTVTTSGNVGIGSAGPATNLDVAKTTAVGTPAIEIRGSGGGPRLQVYGRNADAQAWMGLGTDMAGSSYEHSIYFSNANSGAAGCMTFGSYNGTTYSEKMRILVGGNVGVGTNNPQAPFHIYKSGGGGVVQGEIRVCSDDGQKSRVGMYEESAGSTWGCWMQYNGNGDTMEFGSKRNTVDTSPQMTISSTGTVNVPGVITNQGRPMSMVGKNNGDITGGIMVFNSVAYNIGSMYNSSNGRWTASVAGYYQFTYSGLSSYTTVYPNMRWNKNGSDFGWGATHFNMGGYAGNPHHLQMATSLIIFLAVNDFVEFNVISNGFYGGTTIHSTACCIFLG
jgi:hypothetical protein